MSDSVIVRLKPGLSRDDALDDGTVHFARWSALPRPGLHEVFTRHYDAIRFSNQSFAGAGVVVTVIGPSGLEGSAAISAKQDGINVITIGRHGHADLFLSREPTMSLRQAAVIVYPRTDGGAVRFRVLDLRASRPFEDERGRRFEALEAEGPVFLRCGAYTLFVFPRESGSAAWSESSESAWGEMADPVYIEEAVHEPQREGWARRPLRRPPARVVSDSMATLILPLSGPVFGYEKLLREDENPRGRLVVRSAEGEMTLLLGQTATARGVLLGRYERCDGSRLGILSHPAISRVHALIIEIEGKLYAIDTGSKNGVWIGEERVRVASLVPDLTVALAGKVATLEWSVVH